MISSQMLNILNELAMLFPALLVVVTTRGFFKALAAKISGDDTAQKNGFLSINPLNHVDLMGLSLILFIVFFIGGLFSNYIPRYFWFILVILLGAHWSYPVPINEGNFKNYNLGIILTTLFGSVGNFLVALLFMYIAKYFPINLVPVYIYNSFILVFRMIIELCIFFGVFVLIPIPPFDGGRLLKIFLPNRIYNWLQQYSLFIFLAIFFLPGLSDSVFGIISFITILIKKMLIALVF